MTTLLKLITGFFASPREEDVALDKPDLDSMLAAIIESEESYDIGNVEDKNDNPTKIEFEGDICHYRIGTVTSISSNHGLIDNSLYFDLRNVNIDNLRVGLKVMFLAYRRREQDEWRVRKIISVQDEIWEDEKKEVQEEVAEVRGAATRTIVGQVMSREGRTIIVNPDVTFCLDDVKADFTPIEGDWVELEALVEVDASIADLSGEILTVDCVRPLRSRVFTGTVTQWTTVNGMIERDVYFNMDSCEPGYLPCVQDRVAVQAIESTRGRLSWRALTVVPMFVQDYNKKALDTTAQKPIARELQILVENKNGITITENLDFGIINIGEVKEIVAVVANESDTKKFLLRSRFHSMRGESQMSLCSPGLDDCTMIYPNRTLTYCFSCKGKSLGQSSELFVFTFRGFKIGRYLQVEVQDPSQCSLVPKQVGDLQFERWDRNDLVRKVQLSHRNGIVVSGVRPIKPPAFVPVRLGVFPIPDRLWQAALCSEKLEDVIESVRNTVPCLVGDLRFANYTDRFHSLLYVEEIEQNLRMRQYDIERTCFTFAGPGMEFLALEVPGLAEKRPSLMLGDKVIATADNTAGTQYEGFIHKVCCNEVWLKFNNTFHANYYDGEYAVSFHFSRTPMRRCHSALNLALTHMGEYVLFPNTIRLQEPQLLIAEEGSAVTDVPVKKSSPPRITVAQRLLANGNSAEKNRGPVVESPPRPAPSMPKRTVPLHWFNARLNHQQKEAVRNVLKGEARPLPYVIFGPPGTGKTITLVETVLQILFLIPESRLMVATPSNSSANLITERLLDSGLLRPGDLVRLVGYHCLQEGTLPDRLVPYSTTGDIRLTRGEDAAPGELKTSSNASTLGRHRITVGTCIALGQLYTMGFPRGHFTHVIVDEAGQATEPEILIPLGFLHTNWGQVVLAGDPLQLGPMVKSRVALHFGLGESYLARLLGRFPYQRDPQGFPGTSAGYNPRLVTRLVMNYRSLPEILHLPSSLFYDGQLEPQVSGESSEEAMLLASLAPLLPQREVGGPPALVFHGVRGTNYQDWDCPSWFNPQEIVQVLYYLKLLFNEGISPDDVGVITPYQRQVQKLRGLLEQLEIATPKIGSVEEFQGQERKVIILSAVRSSSDEIPSDLRHALGFVASPRRLNVALTRARALLIVLGNPHLLARDPYWRNVLTYCIERDTYKGCDLPPDLELSELLVTEQ